MSPGPYHPSSLALNSPTFDHLGAVHPESARSLPFAALLNNATFRGTCAHARSATSSLSGCAGDCARRLAGIRNGATCVSSASSTAFQSARLESSVICGRRLAGRGFRRLGGTRLGGTRGAGLELVWLEVDPADDAMHPCGAVCEECVDLLRVCG